jgi:hypothetical protein
MLRTLLCASAGAGVGFLAGFLLVLVAATSAGATGDISAAAIFLGGFLAGAGAVVGALIGGVAELLAYFRIRDEVARQIQGRREAGSDVSRPE